MKTITIQVPDEVANELIEKYPNKKPWRAEKGESHWWFNSSAIETIEYNDEYDNYHYLIGNHHQTKEQAEAYGEQQKAIGRVKLRALELGGGNVDWGNPDQYKYFPIWNYYNNCCDHDYSYYCQFNPYTWLYFQNKEDLGTLISEHSEDLKLIFNVK